MYTLHACEKRAFSPNEANSSSVMSVNLLASSNYCFVFDCSWRHSATLSVTMSLSSFKIVIGLFLTTSITHARVLREWHFLLIRLKLTDTINRYKQGTRSHLLYIKRLSRSSAFTPHSTPPATLELLCKSTLTIFLT